MDIYHLTTDHASAPRRGMWTITVFPCVVVVLAAWAALGHLFAGWANAMEFFMSYLGLGCSLLGFAAILVMKSSPPLARVGHLKVVVAFYVAVIVALAAMGFGSSA